MELKINLSYIKYYLKKVAYYLKNYENDINFRQTVLSNEKLGFILTEIQYINPTLIPEIIEEFSDEKDFYEKCIVFLIKNLYGKLTLEMNEKPFNDFDVNALNKFNIKIDDIKKLFKKLKKPNPIEVRFIPKFLNELKLKIKGKLFILNYNNYNLLEILIGKRYKILNELITSFSENNVDVDIFNKLNKLKNNKTEEMTADEYFLKNFDSNKRRACADFLLDCFSHYPILEDEGRKLKYLDEVTTPGDPFQMISFQYMCDMFNGNKKDFLNEAEIKYRNSKDLIKKNGGSDKKVEIYEKIIMLINEMKMNN